MSENNVLNLNYEETLSRAQKLVYYDFKDSIPDRYKEDAVQELLLHAWKVGDNSWRTLSNACIDYYRVLCRKIYPSVPFVDMDMTMMAEKQLDDVQTVSLQLTVKRIAKGLRDYKCKNVYDEQNVLIAERILDIILEDIDEYKKGEKGNGNLELEITESEKVTKYRFDGISRGYLERRLPDIHFKKIAKGKDVLKLVVKQLLDTHEIEL